MGFIKCLSVPEIGPIFKGLKRARTLFLNKTVQGKRDKGQGKMHSTFYIKPKHFPKLPAFCPLPSTLPF